MLKTHETRQFDAAADALNRALEKLRASKLEEANGFLYQAHGILERMRDLGLLPEDLDWIDQLHSSLCLETTQALFGQVEGDFLERFISETQSYLDLFTEAAASSKERILAERAAQKATLEEAASQG